MHRQGIGKDPGKKRGHQRGKTLSGENRSKHVKQKGCNTRLGNERGVKSYDLSEEKGGFRKKRVLAGMKIFRGGLGDAWNHLDLIGVGF